ncbi:DUF4382 domain-containing protein [Flammeovirga aprica]|uniref:DUF4382 domain-containing protein n=1 Tax=Flammeovirga aprica JL-4 TaxID=694437 RepID=A0A7X9XA60_9BACT|nr:DUF4382 domain-containing protein [Flammeovirga aprica]NME69314.1 DUF4382 domain-containing protein [Flammeovirga aprica JL-4]
MNSKFVLYSLLAGAICFGGCNNDDDNSTASARADVSLRSGGISDSNLRTTATDIPGVDSVVVSVATLTVQVGDQTVTFNKEEGKGYVDLLHFESKDTLIWSDETLPIGEVESAILGLDKNEDSYVIETGSDTPANLKVAHKELSFDVEYDSALATNTKYILKLDMDGSLRLVANGNGDYVLQQGTAGAPKEGVLYIEKVQ